MQTRLIENFHFQNALVMTPQFTLKLSVSDASCNLVGLEMPTRTNVLKRPGILARYFAWLALLEVLHGIPEWTRYRRVDHYGPFLKADGNAWVVGRHVHTTAQDCLCGESGASTGVRREGDYV